MQKGTLAGIAALRAAAVAVAAGGAGAAPKAGSIQKIQAVLSTTEVVPKPETVIPGETGQFTGTWDGQIIRYTLTWKGMSGQAMNAQIRIGARKKAGPIAQPLCVPCISPETGVVPLTPPQAAALKAGRLYVSISSVADPDGELRGQISFVK